MPNRRPSLPVRAAIRLFGLLGHNYALLPVTAPRQCNMCGYAGKFRHAGLYYIRPDAICMSCWSTDRERLFSLYLQKGLWVPEGKSVLHFAPEPNLVDQLKPRAARYLSADLFAAGADVAWNIEEIDCEDQQFDAVVCSHVLEHVDTPKALLELRRVLRPGGKVFLMSPIYEGLDTTYTNPAVTEDEERHRYFHQRDHVRLIGRDFRKQVTDAGFDLEEYSAEPEEIIRHGLMVGEKVFVATHPQ
jgi:SAM-dependent methyltransferase